MSSSPSPSPSSSSVNDVFMRNNHNHNHNQSFASATTATSTTEASAKDTTTTPSVASSLSRVVDTVFISKRAYQYVSDEFHPFHKHSMNVAVHVVTTTLGIWGALMLALVTLDGGGTSDSDVSASDVSASDASTSAGEWLVWTYVGLVLVTTPVVWTGLVHTVLVVAMMKLPVLHVATVTRCLWDACHDNHPCYSCLVRLLLDVDTTTSTSTSSSETLQVYVCLAAMILGYGLQDVSHWLFGEGTYMDSYMTTTTKASTTDHNDNKDHSRRPWMLLVHSVWLLPLVLDSVWMRFGFLPTVFVPRNRTVVVTAVANTTAVQQLRRWIQTHVLPTAETTHVWPHDTPATSGPTQQLEDDAGIYAGFRTLLDATHYSIRPVHDMNELYVTAVGAKQQINSDAVFYTPHTDGPYWFLPFASLYRVLVGVTPNAMVRTRFNLQHESCGQQIVDMYGVLGFDYNRELHWIDHVPKVTNKERRSLLKLHYIVYPKGWHAYGRFCARLNTNYNTWARGNFLKTLRPNGASGLLLAWWIWLTTWFNALWEEHVGWSNLVYVGVAYYMTTPTWCLILTSFRHYCIYMCTFAFRDPPVAHGYLMRDAKLYKTLALLQLGSRMVPLIELPRDIGGIVLCAVGFSITLLATAQLGFCRTYFGSELGFVEPKWIDGFPYNTIPHPMIVGQLVAFGSMLWWWWADMTDELVALIGAHMAFYTAHMVQEMLTSSY